MAPYYFTVTLTTFIQLSASLSPRCLPHPHPRAAYRILIPRRTTALGSRGCTSQSQPRLLLAPRATGRLLHARTTNDGHLLSPPHQRPHAPPWSKPPDGRTAGGALERGGLELPPCRCLTTDSLPGVPRTVVRTSAYARTRR
jgi:hypothetical protein